MTSLIFRNKLICYQLRRFHKSAIIFSTTSNLVKEKQEFQNVLPEVVDSIVKIPKFIHLPEIGNWMKQILDHIVTGGKLQRGLSIPLAYRMLEDPQHFNEEVLHSARVLGWCIEIIQTQLLLLDDIMDQSTTRRGKPCWYRLPHVGISALNDGTLVYQCVMEILDIKFGKTPIYVDLIKHVNSSVLLSSTGQYLDASSEYNKDNKIIDKFTMEHYDAIAVNKTAYTTFWLPWQITLLLVENENEKPSQKSNNICLDLGIFFQIQDDYIDVYGEETTTGKKGTDIEDGKCTWLAVTALERCNDAQRSVFEEYYGSKDPKHVHRIKQLYDELQIPQLYEIYQHTAYEDLMHRIHALPTEGEKKYFSHVLNGYYKRMF